MASASRNALKSLLARAAFSSATSAAATTAAACYAPALLASFRCNAAWSPALPASSMRQLTTGSSPCFSLAKTLEEELSFEEAQYVKPEQIANGPPAPFKLTSTPGDTLLTLTRRYDGEEINVDLHVNNQPSATFEDGEEEESLNFVAFNVSVSKDDKSLVFECESDGTCININHISFEPKDGIEQESMYTGPVFTELDEGLQKHFQDYLEERGITAELGEYLRFLIFDKEQQEYMAWLNTVRDFVSSS